MITYILMTRKSLKNDTVLPLLVMYSLVLDVMIIACVVLGAMKYIF